MKKFFKKIVVASLTWEANIALRKYKPKVVSITGSVGKTTTKNAVYAALASTYTVRKSERSISAELSVPLTVLGLPNGRLNPFIWLTNIVEGFLFIVFPFKYPEWLVLEVGAEKPGDIEKIGLWLKSDVVIVTRFGDVPAHIESFHSIEDLINEKSFLARALKDHGILIYNIDDQKVVKFSESILDKKITYGFNLNADVRGSDDHVTYAPYENSDLEFPEGMIMTINHAGTTMTTRVNGVLGRQHLYPILAAYAVGISHGVSAQALSTALTKLQPPRGRMRLISGIKDTVIIDDSYNSSPVATHAALHALQELKTAGRKIAVLGDMLELGQYSIEEHKKVGQEAARIVNILVTVGIRSRDIAEAALDASLSENNILQFETSQEAGKYLESVINTGDLILIKGSQMMRMERVVEEIMAHPEDKENLLVRQSNRWQNIK